MQHGIARALGAGLVTLTTLTTLNARESTDWTVLQRTLQPGDKVRVVRTNLTSVEGRLAAITADGLIVDEKVGPQTTAQQDVLQVSVNTGRRGRHMLLGLGAGFAAAAAIGIGVRANPDVGHAQAALTLGWMGAAAGLGVGAAVPTTRVVYRKP